MAALEDVMATVQEQIVRLAAIKEVVAAEENERTRRVAEDHMEDVKAQLLRKLSLKSVQTAVEEERKRLITAEVKMDAEEELMRRVAGKTAVREYAAEQERQSREPRQVPADVAAILHKLHDGLLDNIARFHATADARHIAEAEDHKTVVQEQLQHASNARLVDRLADEEQARRLTSPVPETLLDSLSEINAAVERHHNQIAVREAEELERAQRVTVDRMSVVGQQLERQAAQRAADAAMAAEQEHRVLVDRMAGVQDEMMHKVHGREADVAMQAEREYRVAHPDEAVPLATSDALAQLHEAIIRYRAVKDAVNAEEFEQARRIAERQKSIVLDDMLAKMHRKEAQALSEAARAEQDELVKARTPEMRVKHAHSLEALKLKPVVA